MYNSTQPNMKTTNFSTLVISIVLAVTLSQMVVEISAEKNNEVKQRKSTPNHPMSKKKILSRDNALEESQDKAALINSIHNNNDDDDDDNKNEEIKWYNKLRGQLAEQVMRQEVVERDHFMMEKWLIDNINDLHRELKQTEIDFEHYAQVTKNILAQNEVKIKQQLVAAQASMSPLSIPVQLLVHGQPPMASAQQMIHHRLGGSLILVDGRQPWPRRN